MAHDIFISHAQADKAVADLLCATLEERGVRCWIAPRDIRPGTDWGSAIIGAIRQSRAMVLVFSDAANASRHIPREIERAMDLEIPIVPFRIENITPRGSLEYNLALVHWLDAVTPPLESHAHRLADVVTTMLGTSGAPVVQPPHEAVERVSPVTKSNTRWIWITVGTLAAAGLAIAWGATRREPPAVSPAAPTDVSQVVAPNDPPPFTAAPAAGAPALNTAEADPNAAPDASGAAWKSCNGADPNEVIAGCTAVIQSKVDDKEKSGRAFFNRAGVYYLQANHDAAIVDYSQALELGFAPAYTYSNRGLAYAAKKDYTRALADYDQAVQANPAFVDAYRNRALANAVNRRFQAAIADLSTAVKLDPDNMDLRLTRAVAYLLQHDSERSLVDIAAYITKKPDEAAAYRVRGIGYFQQGLLAAAKDDFARCLKVNASDAQALYAQGIAKEMTGDASGRDDTAAALKIDPTILDLMTALGVVRK